MKTIDIYCNYGVLGAEKRNVYTYGEPHFRGTYSDEMTVIVPDGWELYGTISGGAGVTAPWGWDYEINEILSDVNGHPAFIALDKNGRPRTAYLYTAEELEEKKRKEERKRIREEKKKQLK